MHQTMFEAFADELQKIAGMNRGYSRPVPGLAKKLRIKMPKKLRKAVARAAA